MLGHSWAVSPAGPAEGGAKRKPILAAQFDQRMKAIELYAVEHQSLGAISEELGVSVTTLRRWLADVPKVRLGR